MKKWYRFWFALGYAWQSFWNMVKEDKKIDDEIYQTLQKLEK